MPNQLYPGGREGFLAGDIDWDTDVIKVALIDVAGYVFSAAHRFFSEVPAASRTAISPTLSGRTAALPVGGVADADDVIFVAVTGPESEALIIYQDTGVDTTSRLIAYIDTATGLPVLPNGGDITVAWDNGANRIFML